MRPFGRMRVALALLLILLPHLTFAQSWRSVDQGVFDRSIARQMNGRVMGYAFAVADADGIVAEASGGWAQAPGDGDLRMAPNVAINFGSNQKVLSGIALLDLLEERGNSLAQELQTPFPFFMPDKWRNFYFGGSTATTFDRVTLEDLLDHTSGLADEPGRNVRHNEGTKIGWSLSQPVQTGELNNNTLDYNNNNYTLLLYAIPNLVYRDETNALEEVGADLGRSDYNGFAAREYGSLYTRYMTEEFLPRFPVRLDGGTCVAADLSHGRVAKQYTNRNARRGGLSDASGFCRSQGSWSYSVRDMAHILRTIELGNTIVERDTRRMFPASMSPRMIYWRSFSHPWLAKNTRVDTYRAHGGRTPPASTGGGRANTLTIRLPFGHVGVAAVNSDEMNALQLGPVLLNAFYEATRKTFEKDVSRNGSDIANFNLPDPDPEVCRDRCNDNAACKSWTYVEPGIQDPSSARCWLKDDIPAQSTQVGRISGVKALEYDWDRPGSDLRSILIPNGDPAACRLRCAFDRDCKAFTFVGAGVPGQSGRCWLKHRVPPRKRASCCVSGK